MKKIILAAVLHIIVATDVAAQDSDNRRKAYNDFRSAAKEKYDGFRKQCNEKYAKFLEEAWQSFKNEPPQSVPPRQDPPVEPRPYHGDHDGNDKSGHKDDGQKEIKVEEVIKPVAPAPQPKPMEPIREQPVKDDGDSGTNNNGNPATDAPFTFCIYGTEMSVRLTDFHRFCMSDASESSVAQTWKLCSDGRLDNVIRDCLALRLRHGLNDWAYLRMLCRMGDAFFGPSTNEATMLAAYVYCQSGYKMRLGRGDSGRLYLLVASRHNIYKQAFFNIDGDNYYPIGCDESSLHICRVSFPQEQPLSLYITKRMTLTADMSQPRTLQSKRYPNMQTEVSVNKNLLAFYDEYPSSEIQGNFMTRWAMYANAPLDESVKERLYAPMRKTIEGLNAYDAANRLLDFVQTAFVYEYDENVWGADRAFFAEETLYYPYCDCEDRSVLFAHMVRELLSLPVVLIYWPGHLATAVAFNGDAAGDYIVTGGRRFTICDPTYIGAGVGQTMPNMDNGKAKVILLE